MEMRTLGPLLPMLGWRRGLCKRETHHFPKQAPKAGRGGGFLNPTQEVWRGLWACRVLRHWETFEAEAATWVGWGELGPTSSHWTSETWNCCEKCLQFSCLGLAQCNPHVGGSLLRNPCPPNRLWQEERGAQKSCFLYGVCGMGQQDTAILLAKLLAWKDMT